MDSTQQFISKFHQLTGTTAGERRKNLFHLLKTCSHDDIDVSIIRPKNPLEEIFKIDCLIFYNKTEELINSLKSDDPIIVEKILKIGPKFIHNAFKNVTGVDLANDLFPQLSYNTKLKLLHKFSLYLSDEKKADEYFAVIERKYGVYFAAKMLPCCSERIIIQCVKENRVEIVPKHLLKILERHSDIAENLLHLLNLHNSKLEISEKYIWVFTSLAKTNAQVCAKLWETFRPRFKIGARATRTLIKTNKDDFIQNPKRYVNFLTKSKIGKVLQNDFDEFFFKVFPTTITKVIETMDILLLLLKHLKVDNNKLSTLLATFRKVHQREMWDIPVLILPELLKLMEPEERHNFIELYDRPEHISKDRWIAFMKCEKSLPLLKENIRTNASYSKFELCEYLAETCAINRDLNALVDVFYYIKQQNLGMQSDFLRGLMMAFDFSVFGDEHWNSLYEYVELYKTTGNLAVEACYIFGQYISYRLKLNLPVQEVLFSWANSKNVTYSKYSIDVGDPKYEKYCLETFAKMEPFDFPEDSFIDYVQAVNRWNERYPKDRIKVVLTETAWDIIKDTLENKQWVYSIVDVTEQCIYEHLQQACQYKVVEAFFKLRFNNNHMRVFIWLLKNHPQVLLKHVEVITKNVFQQQMVPLYIKNICKYYVQVDVILAMKNICLQNFHNEKGAQVWLSILADADEFKRLCFEDKYKDLIVHLKYASSLSQTSELIKKICVYDYLQYVQRPLYLIAYNVSEERLAPFLESLNDRDLHIKKYTIFLAFKFLSKETILGMLGKFLQDQNPVVCKYVFKGVFNLFIRSPDDRLWDLTQYSLKYLNKNDMEVFRILSSCRRIPNSYFAPYVKFTWFTLENVVSSSDEIAIAKGRILHSLTTDKISSVSEDFCLDIINKYLFKSDFNGNTIGFSCRFIITKPKYVETVFNILADEVRSAHLYQKKTATFVNEFCDNYLVDLALPKEALEKFVSLWYITFKPHEAFYEYLRLHLTLMYVNSIGVTLEKLGENLASFCNSLNEDVFDVEIFLEHFSFFENRFYSLFPDMEPIMIKLTIIESILRSSSSNPCLLFVVHLLPNDELDGKVKCKYESIIDSLWERLSPVATVYLYRHLSG